jgi:Zn-finger protein
MRAELRFTGHMRCRYAPCAFERRVCCMWQRILYLPLIVRFEMQHEPGEYGLLLGCFGLG